MTVWLRPLRSSFFERIPDANAAQLSFIRFGVEYRYQPFIFNYHGVQQTFRGEIIEIGAVKIDEDANVLDTFSIHLRPRIFRCLQHHIAKVTGLTQEDLDKGEPIIRASAAL